MIFSIENLIEKRLKNIKTLMKSTAAFTKNKFWVIETLQEME